MKKHYLLIAGLAIGAIAQTQDYIITWQNDTIACKMPGDAKKIGLKPLWKYGDGYEKIITVFNNDSVRVIKAGEIKGYRRKEHGKKLFCDGFFEAKQIDRQGQNIRTLAEENNSARNQEWFFFSRILEGKYASLYLKYDSDGTSYYPLYYLVRHGIEAENFILPFFNKKKVVELLSENEIANEMKAFKYKKSNQGFAEIVKEYNRLKEAASKKDNYELFVRYLLGE